MDNERLMKMSNAALDFARYRMDYIIDHDIEKDEAAMLVEDIGAIIDVARHIRNGRLDEAHEVALDQDTDPREELFAAMTEAGYPL